MTSSPPPPPPIPLDELVGKRLKGQYLLLKKLGQGGMGAVFKAINETLKKNLAVKVLYLEAGQGLQRPQAEARFRREIELAAQMAQANIAQVFDCGVEYGYPFMVMEYVEGPDLSEILEQESPLPPARALEIIEQLVLALCEAERCGVVHRDIKPQNLKLQRYKVGGDVELKVLDFGIAKNVRDRQDELTQPGTIMGTPSYMAPEQCKGTPHQYPVSEPHVQTLQGDEGGGPRRGGIDGRADLYSAGVILFKMLTGQLPFDGDMMAIIGGHLFNPPPPLPASIPEAVRNLCERLLQKNPDDRYQTARECLDAIRAARKTLLPVSVSVGVPPLPPPPFPWRWVIGFALVLALAGVGGGILRMRWSPTPGPADFAVQDLASPRDLTLVEDLMKPPDLRPVDLAKPKTEPSKPRPIFPPKPPVIHAPPSPPPDLAAPSLPCRPPMFRDSTGRCAL